MEKTETLARLGKVPLALFVKNERNPNKMKPREFDLLCDNLNTTGWTDPILARPEDPQKFLKLLEKHPQEQALVAAMVKQNVKLRIVGGHHRYDAAVYLGFEHGPATIITDPDFDQDMENFQIVRMNTIRGRMDPQSFFDMYSKLSGQYADDVLQSAFGFADENEFKKLINQMAKTLPDKVSQDKFKEAAAEIKTIDGLSKLLNQMFTSYGDQLKHAYMVVDYGGQRSLWLRVNGKTWKALELIGAMCVERSRTMDDIVGGVLQLIARGEAADIVEKLVAETPIVKMPHGAPLLMPTQENIEKMESV